MEAEDSQDSELMVEGYTKADNRGKRN